MLNFFTFFFNTGAQAEIEEEEEEAPKQKNYRHNLHGPKGRFVKKPRDKGNSNLNYTLINKFVLDFKTFFFNTGAQAEIEEEEEEEAPKQKNYRHNLHGPKGRFVKKPRDNVGYL